MDMQKIIKTVWFTPTHRGWGLPLAFEASPGTSKTAQILQVSRTCGFYCEVLSPGERGEGAFGVVPVPDKGVLTYPAPEWTKRFEQDGRGVVFLDELTTAAPALQPPLLGLFLEGRIGGYTLPAGVRLIAAYNKPEEAAAGYDLPAPVANRMGHMLFDAGDVEAWIDWLMTEDGLGAGTLEPINPEEEEERVLFRWSESFAVAKGKVAAFVKRRGELLHRMPPVHDPNASRAWPSRRSWEFATRALAASAIHDLTEDESISLVGAFVGTDVAGEFLTFLKEHDLPDPVELLDGKITFKHEPLRLDRTYAVLSACTALVVPPKAARRDERARVLWTILHDIVKAGAKDVAFGPARRMAKAGHLKHKEARPVLAQLNKVMEAAGITGR